MNGDVRPDGQSVGEPGPVAFPGAGAPIPAPDGYQGAAPIPQQSHSLPAKQPFPPQGYPVSRPMPQQSHPFPSQQPFLPHGYPVSPPQPLQPYPLVAQQPYPSYSPPPRPPVVFAPPPRYGTSVPYARQLLPGQRPRLAPSARRAALTAGLLTNSLIAVGVSGMLVPLLGAGFVSFVLGSVADNADMAFGAGFVLLDAFGSWLALAFFGGLAFWLGGYVLSVRMLRRGGNARPHAITWSGIGISTAFGLPVGAVLGVILMIIGTLIVGGSEADTASVGWVLLVVTIVSVLVTAAGTGTLCWLWMANALRLPIHATADDESENESVPPAQPAPLIPDGTKLPQPPWGNGPEHPRR